MREGGVAAPVEDEGAVMQRRVWEWKGEWLEGIRCDIRVRGVVLARS